MSPAASSSTITHAGFGRTPDGQPVEIYTLRNSKGSEVCILTYGGIVQKLTVPDRHGKFDDVVLGFDTLAGYTQESYVQNCPFFGAIIGRYGNRIGGAKFALDGRLHTLAGNDNGNSLHGGNKGFHAVVWTAKSSVTAHGPQLTLTYLSPDGEEGFPGNLEVTAVYTLTEGNELKQECTAKTDQPTLVNLTHHSYFNLVGQGNGDILNHLIYINADKITPVESSMIPTGAMAEVTGTPFDFRTPTAIGARIDHADELLQHGRGYDLNWVINKPLGKLGLHARVLEPVSGRTMELWSDEPGLQFYTGNFLNGSLTGKGGRVYHHRTGFCMEPQHFPDSPNKSHFPSTELRPGETYHNTIVYKFGVK